MNVDEARAFLAQETLLLSKLDDAEKVQYFQARTLKAEEALKQAETVSQITDVLKEFPAVEIDDVKDLKSIEEVKIVATRLQAKAAKFEAKGQTTVEEAVKEALKVKDEEIVEIRKVYGKARQPQAGDVTGSGIAQTQAAAALGIGVTEEKPKTVEESIRSVADPMLRRLGLKQ